MECGVADFWRERRPQGGAKPRSEKSRQHGCNYRGCRGGESPPHFLEAESGDPRGDCAGPPFWLLRALFVAAWATFVATGGLLWLQEPVLWPQGPFSGHRGPICGYRGSLERFSGGLGLDGGPLAGPPPSTFFGIVAPMTRALGKGLKAL